MSELLEHLDRAEATRDRAALATLVSTRGTTPRREGARMVVAADGSVLGSITIGGCVDARVVEEAGMTLGDGAPRLLELALGDEEAWEIGLTCGGTVEVFVEPLTGSMGGADREVWERLRHAEEGGRRVALVTRLDAAGGKLLVEGAGGHLGTLGSPALDERFAALARSALGGGATGVTALDGIRAFVEVCAPPLRLVIVGAGHVAMVLARLAHALHYDVVVLDGRPGAATPERFPDARVVRAGIPSELVREYPLGPSGALVLLAHDYKYDVPVLRHALGTGAGYIGLLGSRRRGTALLELLREEGVPEAALERVRVPIGLDLGARAAPEIALAILAEVEAVRTGASCRPLCEGARGRVEA